MRECVLTLYDRDVGDLSEKGERMELRKVFATLKNCGQREYFKARQQRFEPAFTAEVWGEEYRGEHFAQIADTDTVYKIYRSYDNEETGKTELYLTKKIGVI